VAVRAAAIRSGPLRLAVVANVDAPQADAATRAVDRWIARRAGETRSCPPVAAPATPRSGTYSVSVPAGAVSEVLIGVPIPPSDAAARVAATWIAAALDGDDGLLAHALGGNSASGGPLARTWSATVLGAPQASVLVIRLAGPDPAIDPAVAQVRALLDRLRQGAVRDDDRARAAAALARGALAGSLDPRARVVDLWRGASPAPLPSIDDLRAFAAATLRDESLIIVAARPPRPPPPDKSPAH
jgi:hypothetical protein